MLGPPTTITPAALVGADVPVEEHRVPAAWDAVVVVHLNGGGLISYHRPDGVFVHTLGDAGGFERKLAQLARSVADKQQLVRSCWLHADHKR